MRIRAARLLIPLVLLAVIIAFVLFWRARSQGVYGPALAFCPGPDRYGYTCEGAAAYAYVDAATPTGLVADDGVARLDLPFPFTFYGATYDALNAGSNGNLQFTTRSPIYATACTSPAVGLGDLIAPYWADLDLTNVGALETAVVGQSPARVFVIEWDDVPLYGPDLEDRVTFEAQLFETSNDIVFLYTDPTTAAGGNGGAAVVGIQSERQELALSYSCRQPVLPSPGGLRLVHPAEPNPRAGEPEDDPAAAAPTLAAPQAKGPLADLIAAYETQGLAALAGLRLHWLGERPARAFAWQAADLTGDAGQELVAVWSGGPGAPHLTQVAALGVAGERPVVLFDWRPVGEVSTGAVSVVATADLTGDGLDEVVLRDAATGATWVLSAAGGAPALLDVPERCTGGLVVRDGDGDGRPELIRDGCATPGRLGVVWDGAAFVPLP